MKNKIKNQRLASLDRDSGDFYNFSKLQQMPIDKLNLDLIDSHFSEVDDPSLASSQKNYALTTRFAKGGIALDIPNESPN